MKLLLVSLLTLNLYADIIVINGIYSKINFEKLKKYSYKAKLYSSYNMQKHLYTFILLSKLKELYCPYSKKIEFVSYNNKVVFSKKEIKKNNIAFVFQKNNKPLIENSAQIIYIKNKNPIKEIYKIQKVVCVK